MEDKVDRKTCFLHWLIGFYTQGWLLYSELKGSCALVFCFELTQCEQMKFTRTESEIQTPI